MPAKLSLQCDSRDNQNRDCGQALHPFPGPYQPSIVGVHFRHGAVLNSPLLGCRIGWLYLSEQSSNKRMAAYEAVAIATHTMSQQRLLEG